jgi:hypothetical protein
MPLTSESKISPNKEKKKKEKVSMSRFSEQYGILNIPQPYRPPRPVKGVVALPEDVSSPII